MAARDKAPFLIRFAAFWGQLALFFGIVSLLGGPVMMPMHQLPPDLYWLAEGGNLIAIGIFLLMPGLMYRLAMWVMRLVRPEAIIEQLRSLQQAGRNAGNSAGGWREEPAPRQAAKPLPQSRRVQSALPEDTAVRCRRDRTPLIRR